jgi:hypothetical protein
MAGMWSDAEDYAAYQGEGQHDDPPTDPNLSDGPDEDDDPVGADYNGPPDGDAWSGGFAENH